MSRAAGISSHRRSDKILYWRWHRDLSAEIMLNSRNGCNARDFHIAVLLQNGVRQDAIPFSEHRLVSFDDA